MILATTSSALFDLSTENHVFQTLGEAAYSAYQIENEQIPLQPGFAFNLVRKFSKLNSLGLGKVVEIILLSRNSADSGLRVMSSIAHYGLGIEQAAFSGGTNPHLYAKAFGASLFLSSNADDVCAAISNGTPAAMIVTGSNNSSEEQIKIAFDGDACLFDRNSEDYFQQHGLEAFNANEKAHANEPMQAGPLKPFLEVLHALQAKFPGNQCPVRTALITARGAPAHERVVRTLRAWEVRLDETVFLAGRDKGEFAHAFGADLFFDDSRKHVDSVGKYTAAAQVLSHR